MSDDLCALNLSKQVSNIIKQHYELIILSQIFNNYHTSRHLGSNAKKYNEGREHGLIIPRFQTLSCQMIHDEYHDLLTTWHMVLVALARFSRI